MSGHSKWSKIKRQKGINDVAKGALFSKLSRIITLAVLEGGGLTDPDLNIKLRLAVEKGKQLNLPKENIARAIEKGTGPNKSLLKEAVYEAFAPHGVAAIIHATTDNANRTFTEIRNLVEKMRGKMGVQGSVGYLFERCATIRMSGRLSEEDILGAAERLQAIDVEQDHDGATIYFPFELMGKAEALLKPIEAEVPEVEYRPSATITLTEEQQSEVVAFIEAVENLDDVQTVYTNAEFN